MPKLYIELKTELYESIEARVSVKIKKGFTEKVMPELGVKGVSYSQVKGL